MADYGVLPTGFARKPLPVILSEIEAAARQVFGQGVIQSPESPLGQLNGLMASIIATEWEVAEDTYQSYDPDQAKGVRLEQLGRIRLLERNPDEIDPAFRQAITNAGRARIDLADIYRAVTAVDGVTWARIVDNPKAETSPDGLPPHSLAILALGGTDADIAAAARPYVVPGIDTYGNVRVDITVDGYCRTLFIGRPRVIPVGLNLTIATSPDRFGCPPPSSAAIVEAVANGMSGDNNLRNGGDLTLQAIRVALAQTFTNVEVVSANVVLLPSGAIASIPYPIEFFEIVSVDRAFVTATEN